MYSIVHIVYFMFIVQRVHCTVSTRCTVYSVYTTYTVCNATYRRSYTASWQLLDSYRQIINLYTVHIYSKQNSYTLYNNVQVQCIVWKAKLTSIIFAKRKKKTKKTIKIINTDRVVSCQTIIQFKVVFQKVNIVITYLTRSRDKTPEHSIGKYVNIK